MGRSSFDSIMQANLMPNETLGSKEGYFERKREKDFMKPSIGRAGNERHRKVHFRTWRCKPFEALQGRHLSIDMFPEWVLQKE